MEILNIVTLALSSLLLTMVGLLRLTNPIKNYAKNSGITLNSNVDLLNEMRGVSGVMLGSGLILFSGIFLSEMRFSSFVVGTLIFLGFALGRTFSLMADGKPNKQIVMGLCTELVLGGLNVFCAISS